MRKAIILALSLLTIPAFGQVSVPAQPAIPAFTIPAPDGKTITSSLAGVWSCVVPSGSALPSTWTVDPQGNLTLPSITTTKLTLTGGTTYKAGQYLVAIDANGNITYTPYVAPSTTTSGGSAPIKALISVPAIAAWGQATGTVKVPGAVPPTVSGTTVTGMGVMTSIIPSGTPNGYFFMNAYVSAAGVISWQFIDQSGSARSAQNFIATVQ